MRYLGIDYGGKRIGLAFGDSETKIAVPFTVLDNPGVEAVLDKLTRIIKDEDIGEIVVGMPYSLGEDTGAPGEQEKIISDFIARLGAASPVPVREQDERFTSAQVEKLLAGQKYPKEKKDAVAAMLILQGYLDKI
ncbi:MAG: Holliday junction resolvase RuvX [Patescibacteria group bacterium]|nr:Holliday junction resolvase RuvX [Patescibacteria group bacterium]